MQLFCVGQEHAGERLDVFLSAVQSGLTRSHARQLIAAGHVRVMGVVAKPSRRLRAGEHVALELPAPRPLSAVAQELPLSVVYEDADVVVVDKARGMVVHPAAGNPDGTLVNALLHRCGDLGAINDVVRPGIVHRLDKDTTGLLVVAKNEAAQLELARQIRERTARRAYLALVHGIPVPGAGVIDAPLGRHPVNRKRMAVRAEGGRRAVTRYRLREALGAFALVRAELVTGRTHQIRVHFAYIGHPVVGDPVYSGRRDTLGLKGQALHAYYLGFYHPAAGQWVEFEAPLPPDFRAVLAWLREKQQQ